MPNTGNTADFCIVIIHLDLISGASNIFKLIIVMCNSYNTADITGRSLDSDIGCNIGNRNITFSHKSNHTADIGAVVFRVCLDIAVIRRINHQIRSIRIKIFSKHPADISITVHFDYSGKLDIGIS